jgi:hypothetical protein
MKKRIVTAFACCVAMIAVFLYAPQSHAFDVGTTTATRLTPEYTLFTISYQFGFLNRELLMPYRTERNPSGRGSTVGYTIRTKDGAPYTTGEAAAIVLAKAPLIEHRYFTPTGRNTDFTLAVLVDDATLPSGSYLTIDRLPFTLKDGALTVEAAVGTEERAAYRSIPLPEAK